MQVFSSLASKQLLALLQHGAVGVLPTDTLYGLVCRAADRTAVKRLYALKHRERKPGTVIAASIEQLAGLGIKLRYLKAVEQFWPGPVSVIVPTPPELAYIDMGLPDLAVRVVEDATVRALVEQTGPLLTSSANLPGEPPAVNFREAEAYFADGVDFYVDGKDFSGRKPSTVLRMVDDAIEVLRQGAVTIDENGRATRNDI